MMLIDLLAHVKLMLQDKATLIGPVFVKELVELELIKTTSFTSYI